MTKGDGIPIAAGCAIVLLWLVSVAASLGLVGVIIWAIIRIVGALT